MENLEYYKLIKTTVQLREVKLNSINCSLLDENSKNRNLSLHLKRQVEIISDTEALIKLHANIHFKENAPFLIDVVYQGKTHLLDETVDRDTFEKYNHDSVVPLLLPYARECVSSLLAKMSFPIYTIPTMDILESIKQNQKSEKKE
ncbi:protein-export chaperone SecB [Bacillus licheniformis]|uniref:protein-export chaperone SecB n=1 Tax=Bacillus licheniformis TaxID=1402 RepID=UPI0011A9E9D7|nr:protein-export chaperone SecB [Bacillus licheniformis]MED1024619.1 protein-export chaperone SecB [Bacillus licheniformis]MED1033029.1 protein-export chaperone SecB [Bacillus licheniformis]MED1102347.1 protein-export chaperone SecB [Bacillus licheniformis]MED1142352.1 protein-export chaperone SecB [Bacillus licheniformis]